LVVDAVPIKNMMITAYRTEGTLCLNKNCHTN